MKKLTFVICTAFVLACSVPASAQTSPDNGQTARTSTTDNTGHPDYNYLGLLGLLGLVGLRGRKRIATDDNTGSPNVRVRPQ